jgi:hypothetical protein
MTYDPYREEDLRRDLPRTEPRQEANLPEARSSMWLPMALAVVLIMGIAYFMFGDRTSTTPSTRADSGAVTKSEPSPN